MKVERVKAVGARATPPGWFRSSGAVSWLLSCHDHPGSPPRSGRFARSRAYCSDDVGVSLVEILAVLPGVGRGVDHALGRAWTMEIPITENTGPGQTQIMLERLGSALGLGRVKTLWQKTACSFRAPNPFTITGERGLADRRWNEASIVSEERIRRILGLMTRAQPGPYVLVS